jgi:hypothetical protein
MTLSELRNILQYIQKTYLSYWYNHTLPLSFSKVAEDNSDFRITEKHLQALWNNQKFLRETLLDDQKNKLKILKPGTWNREPGPDFKNGLLELNGKRISGDIELHLTPELWNAHGHQFDPNYNNVKLHIVWENRKFTRVPPHIPVLELKSQLAVSTDKIWELTDITNYSKTCIHPNAECSEYINLINDQQLRFVFRAAGLSRLQRKAAQFKLSVMKYGLQQAFFLLIADALGFKNNRKAFRQLADAACSQKLNSLNNNEEKEAYLWGKSNLLPDTSQNEVLTELVPFTEKVWKNWWHLRESSDQSITWSRSSQRPFNSPERRLAALVAIMEKCDYKIEDILLKSKELIQSPNSLKEWFAEFFELESPWTGMCNFKRKLQKPCRLIGNSRQLDIIVNSFLPALAYLNGNDIKANEQLYMFYCSLPKSQDNHILDIAKYRFFIPPARMKHIVKKSVDQQGVMQLMQDFDLPETPNAIISFWEELGIPLEIKQLT